MNYMNINDLYRNIFELYIFMNDLRIKSMCYLLMNSKAFIINFWNKLSSFYSIDKILLKNI